MPVGQKWHVKKQILLFSIESETVKRVETFFFLTRSLSLFALFQQHNNYFIWCTRFHSNVLLLFWVIFFCCFHFCYVIVVQCHHLSISSKPSRLISRFNCSQFLSLAAAAFHFVYVAWIWTVPVYFISVEWRCRQRCLCNLRRSNVWQFWQKLDNCRQWR